MMDKQYTFYFDASKCSGCKTCQIACKDKNNLELGILWRRVYEICSGEWINKNGSWFHTLKAYNVSIACNHCEIPICTEVCPTKAMNKNDIGIVAVNKNICVGCGYCELACPYGAPQYDKKCGVMTKCDLCLDYVSNGKNPSCVDACPMRVLDFGEVSKMKDKYGNKNEFFPLPKSDITKPGIIINPDSKLIESNNSDVEILNKEEV